MCNLPMKDSDRIERVRSTWALAAADPARTGQVFYSILFRVDPTTKPLFVGDLELQSRKLVQTLTYIVDNLEDPDSLLPTAIDLAITHVGYGVMPEQYASVGQALMEALRQLLGPSFSAEDQEAWGTTYEGLSSEMIKAAYAA